MTTQAKRGSSRPPSRGRKALAALVLAGAAVLAAGCGSSGSSSSSSAPSSSIDKTPVTLTLWDLWAGREKKLFDGEIGRFQKKYPWITVKQIPQPNTPNDTFDPNLVQAIKGGNAPDVAMPFGPDYVGQYCSSGLWEDLTPYMKADHISISSFAPAAVSYTNWKGAQCALPSLTDAYGLYYNKDLLAKAGIAPPKTMDELMADAKKLTVRNPDGTIKIAGFVPLNFWEELGPYDLAHAWGAKWFNAQNQPVLATDPGWATAFEWQKQLVDWYGYDNIQKFFATYSPAEFSATNAFENGKVALMFDGEWRTQFIKAEHPELNYGTTFFPAAVPSAYGSGRVGGTIIGIPKGSKHPQDAWLLVKFLSTDTNYLVTMANDLGNVPTTAASGNSPDLKLPPQFKTFVHVWANPQSGFSPPLQPSGGGYADLVNTFDDKWVKGQIPDLHAALVQLDQQIQNQLSQGSAP
jgi:multiple sugar transport system substrate-binding protein